MMVAVKSNIQHTLYKVAAGVKKIQGATNNKNVATPVPLFIQHQCQCTHNYTITIITTEGILLHHRHTLKSVRLVFVATFGRLSGLIACAL